MGVGRAWIHLLLVALLLVACNGLSSSSTSATTSFAQLHFDSNGVCFSPRFFRDEESGQLFSLRNVPGEGDCMFLAVQQATLLCMGLEGAADTEALESMARDTRKAVSRVLQSPGSLIIDKDQPLVPAEKLLAKAVAEEQTTTDDYLRRLETIGRLGGMYGGGPELAVLSNILRRPISIYEFSDSSVERTNEGGECLIECQGTFGSFDDPLPRDSAVDLSFSWHLHVLVIDVTPTEKHACVLLPQSPTTR